MKDALGTLLARQGDLLARQNAGALRCEGARGIFARRGRDGSGGDGARGHAEGERGRGGGLRCSTEREKHPVSLCILPHIQFPDTSSRLLISSSTQLMPVALRHLIVGAQEEGENLPRRAIEAAGLQV